MRIYCIREFHLHDEYGNHDEYVHQKLVEAVSHSTTIKILNNFSIKFNLTLFYSVYILPNYKIIAILLNK